MRWLWGQRPSPAMAVASAALLIALGGTALAASNLVSGDKLIRKGSLSANRLRRHSITGAQVNFKRLGAVPTARRLAGLTFRSDQFNVPPNSRLTSTIACDAGTFAVGGGTTSPSENTAFTDYLVDSHPTSDQTGWQVTVENETGGALTETGWAVCVPAASTSVATSSSTSSTSSSTTSSSG